MDCAESGQDEKMSKVRLPSTTDDSPSSSPKKILHRLPAGDGPETGSMVPLPDSPPHAIEEKLDPKPNEALDSEKGQSIPMRKNETITN